MRKWMVNAATLARLTRYRVQPADLLVTITGNGGRTCVVPADIGVAVEARSQDSTAQRRIVPRFVSVAINFDRETIRRLHGRAIGGVMPGLNATKLRESKRVKPSMVVGVEFIA